MLHKVRTEQLKVGMYIAALDCSWLESPFWRRQFPIVSQDDIAMLKSAGVVLVSIDDRKGVGPERRREDASTSHAPPTAAAKPAPVRPRVRASAPSEEEYAREVVERSRAAVTAMFQEARMGHAIQTEIVGPLVDDIAASVSRDAEAMLKVTRLKNKNEYTYLHSVAVCALMINFARRLGIGEGDVRRVGMAGLLHDVGKMMIPDLILEKPGPLDDGERLTIETHPIEGHRLLQASTGMDDIALDVCLHHHERVDGGGYPFGKTGDELSIYARMGAICDVYDAVTSHRPYKSGWSPNESLQRMLGWEGHFDPILLDTFIDSIGIPPRHSLVRLASHRLGLVCEGNDADPTAPRVRAFYAIPDQRFRPLDEVDTGGPGATDAIIQRERGEHWFGTFWEQVRDQVVAGQPCDERRTPSPRFLPVEVIDRRSAVRSAPRIGETAMEARR